VGVSYERGTPVPLQSTFRSLCVKRRHPARLKILGGNFGGCIARMFRIYKKQVRQFGNVTENNAQDSNLDLKTASSQKCEAIPRRARIQGS